MGKKRSIFYGWYIVLACTLITSTFFTLLQSCVGHFAVPICEALGISRSAYSTFSTLLSVTCMILSPAAGKLCARGNTRLIMSTALLFGIIGYTGVSFVKSIAALYVLAVFIGVCFTFGTTVPIAVMINRWFIKANGTAMSITFAGSSLGAMILSPIINALISGPGWRSAIRYLGAGMLLIILPAVYLICRSYPDEIGLQPYGVEAYEECEGRKDADSREGLSLRELKKQPVFYVYIAGMFIMLLTLGTMYHLVPHVTLLINATAAARFVSIFSFIGVGGKILMGAVFDRSVRGGIILGTAGMTLTFIFLLIAKDFAMLLPTALVYGIGSAHATIFPTALTARFFGSKHYGENFGFVYSFTSLSMAVNGLIMAAFFDVTGSYTPAWMFGLAAAGVAAVLLFIAKRGAEKLLDEKMLQNTDFTNN